MKRFFSTSLAFLLALTMLLGVLASCVGNTEISDDTDSTAAIGGETTESNCEGSESESEKPDDGDKEPEIVLTGDHATLITESNKLANGVQAFFPSADRTHYSLSNTEMIMNYARSSRFDQLVESIKNHNGAAYIQNTMDVFVRMANGDSYDTFYASQSLKSAEANLYRFGYYYYQGLFEFQNFIPKEFEISKSTDINIKNQYSNSYEVTRGKDGNGMSYTINENANDPRIMFEKSFDYSTAEYDTLVIKIKALGNTNGVQLFVKTDTTNYSEASCTSFSVENDGEYHTYYIFLSSIPGYDGKLKGIRFDPNGAEGGGIAIESMTLGKAEIGDIPSALSINRHFHVYSDKMHHAIQFAVTERTENIVEVGMLTEIEANTVSKIIIVTDDGKNYDSLDAGFAWGDVVAVGFDVTAAGIFGFILPKDDIAGKIKVELKDGTYVIKQTRTPEVDGVSGVIIPSIDTEKRDENGNYKHAEGVSNNGNDFYIGQRVYTDENHSFDEFLQETHFERNPLDAKRVSVSQEGSDGAGFAGYDAMRGIYVFNVATPAGGFSVPYNNPNKNYKVNFSIRSDIDRNIYAMTAGSAGILECATLMDEDMMLLPVPIEVIKNFSEATGERNLYNISDPLFSEAIFYLPLEQNKKQEYTLINLYQNWGKYPLKQLSQIPFHCPYYHLSTGVTETNCIVPWFGTASVGKSNGGTLPDFRSMSAPHWVAQPQHNSCGAHTWLAYTDTDGGTYYVEATNQNITSYGPTYAEVVWENLSDDGKIKVTYTHMEMPQVDENRSYYTMEYEFLADLTIDSFKDNFQFYDVTDNNGKGTYKKLGYLNEQNEYAVIDSNQDPKSAPEYVLGDNCPYFSFFMMPDWDRESTSAEGYANVAFLIYNSEFIVGGAEKDYGFLIRNKKDHVTLTLNESGTVAFKAGDKITINAILLPWGSQQYEDDPANRLDNAKTQGFTEYTYSTVLPDGTLYMDKNVRDVRENTLLNPLTVTSETDEIIESPFLPKVRSKDGKTAEITLSGGENNVTVRVYGFDKLTAPKVEEFVDGEWQEYVISSKDTPDHTGLLHYYDGYMVNYDGDGTYSYSFVTTMYDGAPRKFRISAEDDFTYWPADPELPENENFLDIYIDHEEYESLIKQAIHMYGQPVLGEDEEQGPYTSVYVKLDNALKESYSTLHMTNEDNIVTGKYLVIKYRVPKSNTENVGKIQIWASTTTSSAVEAGSFTHTPVADGKWHVDVIDLSKTNLQKYTADDNGNYCAKLLRIDMFNKEFQNADTHIDVAYIGMDDDLYEICKLEQEKFETITLVEDGKNSEIDINTGEAFVKTYIDPSSGYTESKLAFVSILDKINGVTANINSSSNKDGVESKYNVSVTKKKTVNVTGWVVVDGGIEKYVYSFDDGKTWIDCNSTISEVSDDIMAYIQRNKFEFTDLEAASLAGGRLGGGGITLDLSSCKDSVDVVIAAVPKMDTKTLVLLYCLEDVNCTLQTTLDASSGYEEIALLFGSQVDSINGVVNVKTASNTEGYGTYLSTATRDDNTILVKGWAAVDGGVTKYVWTADGGKTWNDCGGASYVPKDGADGTCAIITVGQKKTGGTFASADATKKNAGFQGEGLIIDLSAYADSAEPLKVYLCAVPETNNEAVVILYCFDGITFPAK